MMTVEEAKTLCEELRGRFDSPFSILDKQTIERLYYEVLGKQFVKTSCQQCYHDGLIEIYLYLKKNNAMKERCKARLRAGFIIACPTFHGGKVFTNDNLTDEIAAEYLEQFPSKAVFFAEKPEKVEKTVTAKEMPRKAVRTKKTKK
jgi:hypothetical protein